MGDAGFKRSAGSARSDGSDGRKNELAARRPAFCGGRQPAAGRSHGRLGHAAPDHGRDARGTGAGAVGDARPRSANGKCRLQGAKHEVQSTKTAVPRAKPWRPVGRMQKRTRRPSAMLRPRSANGKCRLQSAKHEVQSTRTAMPRAKPWRPVGRMQKRTRRLAAASVTVRVGPCNGAAWLGRPCYWTWVRSRACGGGSWPGRPCYGPWSVGVHATARHGWDGHATGVGP